MGNNQSLKHELNESNFLIAEENLLRLSGLDDDKIIRKNVLVAYFDDLPIYMWTLICGD